MKKLLFIIIFVASTISCWAQLSNAQLNLRSDIVDFLKTEGYVPEIDSDGDIKFKAQGSLYFIKVSDNDDSPMFVTLTRYFNYPEEFSRNAIKVASAEINLYKMVKLLCLDDLLLLRCELYLQSPETFKYAFFKMLDQLQSAEGDLYDECKKAQDQLSGR